MPSGAGTSRSKAWICERLRAFDNPFDEFVEARGVGVDFVSRHVGEINRTAQDVVRSALSRYALATQATGPDAVKPPRSGVLVVYGRRGSGKTHLLHVLQKDDGVTTVAPTHFDPRRPFDEFLLHQLVRTLQEDLGRESGQLFELADWFSKSVLTQALGALPECEWIAHLAACDVGFWRLRFGAPDPQIAPTPEVLLSGLARRERQTLADLLEHGGLDTAPVSRILHGQVDRHQEGQSPAALIESALYHHLIDFALGGDPGVLSNYLVDDFTQVSVELPPEREQLVDGLFGALARLLLLAGRPVMFAFDSLETLFRDPPDMERCGRFTSSLADALDARPGVMFLILAEDRYFQALIGSAGDFAVQRIEQGVPLAGAGTEHRAELVNPGRHGVEVLIRQRLAPYLGHIHQGEVPDDEGLGPFTADDVRRIAREEDPPPLRQILQALRARYHKIVFSTRHPDGAPPPCVVSGEASADVPVQTDEPTHAEAPGPRERLEEIWASTQKRALEQIRSDSPSAYADELLAGLEAWLHVHMGQTDAEGHPALSSTSLLLAGSHPTYGQIVRCTGGDLGDGPDIGLGVLLGRGGGMPRDLRAKLEVVNQEPPTVDHLLILWPRAARSTEPAETMPDLTGRIWSEFRSGPLSDRAEVRVVSLADAGVWLGFEAWRRELESVDPVLFEQEGSAFAQEMTLELWERVRSLMEACRPTVGSGGHRE